REIREDGHKDYDEYPRNIIKHALAYLRETGIADEMIIGPEYEFTVLDSVRYHLSPEEMSYHLSSREADWNNEGFDDYGNSIPAGEGYHCALPLDSSYDLRNDICTIMKQFGLNVKYHHHEVGESGQMEIEVELGDAAKLADDTILAKYIIRNTAQQHGRTATLMPKPIYKEAGNGMHVHMLLKKNGKNIFHDDNGYGKLSQTAMYFIGGLLHHVRSLCAFTNPTTNSYKRLVPGFEAPVTIGYAMANRSAVIRIPAYVKSEDSRRFELRNPDATCNPYFAYAAILMAGIDGIRNKISPQDVNWGPFDFNLYELSEEQKKMLQHLPSSIAEALSELENDHSYLLEGGVFPESLIKTWIREIRRETEEIERIPTPAEFARYYNR
ncbi:MAG: type I glutamate--ammonia ligase, partial [Erysipelotrichaceae bacterium]|nr:type I glutamate--ammonia ligase [Erysipelotrichaceae bacterium]